MVRRSLDERSEAASIELSAETQDSSAATASPKARITSNFRYTNGRRPTMALQSAAFQPEDVTSISGGEVQVGRRVELVDGKVDGYSVTWIGDAPATGDGPTLSYVASVSDGGSVGGNVTLVGGFAFVNPLGRDKLTVIETYGAVISFNTNLCWYLDSTFCSYFHQLKNVEGYTATMVLLVLQVILFSIFSLAALIDGFQLFRILSKTACHSGSCLDKMKRFIDEIGKCGIVGLTFRLLCLWTPPIAYWYLFLPCWQCFDFEGAATHEIGHVLGLSHPDTASEEVCKESYCNPEGGRNSYAMALNGKTPSGGWKPIRMNSSSCQQPWDTVQEFPKDADAAPFPWHVKDNTRVRDTIMEAFTQHNPSVCLTHDDLEALNVNYPQCEHAISEPVCFKSDYYIGWIRLGVWVGIPIIICLFFIMLLSALVRRHHIKRMDSAHQLVREKSRDLRHQRGAAQRASCEAAQLAEALDMQIATEESRIQERAHRMSVQMVNKHLEQLQQASQGSSGGAAASGRGSAGVSTCSRGASFIRSFSGLGGRGGGTQDGAQQGAGGRKWLGGGGGAFSKSMKKVSSALGMQRAGASDDDVEMNASRGDSPDPPENLITVPDQYRLNSIRGSEANEPGSPGCFSARGSNLGELSNVVESEESHNGGLGHLDRTKTIRMGGGGAARVTGMDDGSRTSFEGTDSLDPANPGLGVTSI